MNGVGRGVRTLHQCPQLHHLNKITSLISQAPRPPPLRLVLPRPLMAITTAGNPRIHTNPTALVAITLPLTSPPNTTPKGLPMTPFSRAFIALPSYKLGSHPFFYILQPASFGFANRSSSRPVHHCTTTFCLRGVRNELLKTTWFVFPSDHWTFHFPLT